MIEEWEGSCLTDWLNGSGGTGETPSQLLHISGKTRLRASGRAAVRWSRCWEASLKIKRFAHISPMRVIDLSLLLSLATVATVAPPGFSLQVLVCRGQGATARALS